MSEMIKEALSEQELSGINGGNGNNETYPWTPKNCKGQVIRKESHKGYDCYVYEIAYGDTLSQIAISLTYDSSYNKLARFNGIKDVDVIYAGKTIYCPIGPYNA